MSRCRANVYVCQHTNVARCQNEVRRCWVESCIVCVCAKYDTKLKYQANMKPVSVNSTRHTCYRPHAYARHGRSISCRGSFFGTPSAVTSSEVTALVIEREANRPNVRVLEDDNMTA